MFEHLQPNEGPWLMPTTAVPFDQIEGPAVARRPALLACLAQLAQNLVPLQGQPAATAAMIHAMARPVGNCMDEVIKCLKEHYRLDRANAGLARARWYEIVAMPFAVYQKWTLTRRPFHVYTAYHGGSVYLRGDPSWVHETISKNMGTLVRRLLEECLAAMPNVSPTLEGLLEQTRQETAELVREHDPDEPLPPGPRGRLAFRVLFVEALSPKREIRVRTPQGVKVKFKEGDWALATVGDSTVVFVIEIAVANETLEKLTQEALDEAGNNAVCIGIKLGTSVVQRTEPSMTVVLCSPGEEEPDGEHLRRTNVHICKFASANGRPETRGAFFDLSPYEWEQYHATSTTPTGRAIQWPLGGRESWNRANPSLQPDNERQGWPVDISRVVGKALQSIHTKMGVPCPLPLLQWAAEQRLFVDYGILRTLITTSMVDSQTIGAPLTFVENPDPA